MKPDTIALTLVALFALAYVVAFLVGMLGTLPYSLVLLIPGLIFLGLFAMVIKQRLGNKEDDYYEQNVDK